MKWLGALVGVFMALAGPGLIAYGGYWWAMDRPAWHIGWCPFCLGWGPGANSRLAAYVTAEKAAQAHARAVEGRQAQISTDAARHERQAQAAIQVRYRTITREVHDVLPPATDARYPVPWGFVRVFNAGATGLDVSDFPLAAGQSDDSASPYVASAVAAATVDNDARCRSNAQRLADLQAWVRDQQAASK